MRRYLQVEPNLGDQFLIEHPSIRQRLRSTERWEMGKVHALFPEVLGGLYTHLRTDAA
jgi:hypothetical protein